MSCSDDFYGLLGDMESVLLSVSRGDCIVLARVILHFCKFNVGFVDDLLQFQGEYR